MKTIQLKDKKGQLVTNTIFGVGGLIIGVIVILIITSTLLTSNLFSDNTVNSGGKSELTKTVNESGVNFANSTLRNARCTLTSVVNGTSFIIIDSTNYTVANCNIKFSGVGHVGYNNTAWRINYTSLYDVDSAGETSSVDIEQNFTTGIGNVSAKIPTILLIIAVVFLFGALVILVNQSKSMGIGGGSGSSSQGSL